MHPYYEVTFIARIICAIFGALLMPVYAFEWWESTCTKSEQRSWTRSGFAQIYAVCICVGALVGAFYEIAFIFALFANCEIAQAYIWPGNKCRR